VRIYFDSSALAKRYIAEPFSDIVIHWCRQASEILLSVISVPEMISSFNRLRREGKLVGKIYSELKREVALDIVQATVINLDSEVLNMVILCLERTEIRTLDAIHVASAKAGRCDLFVSADLRQIKAAKQMGLKIEALG